MIYSINFLKVSTKNTLFLVGDGKTYLHLMQIKRQYGESLENLLIFPGDWHILKNYQEVLMKIYYVAGLREIAMVSGYRGMTLQSLETAKSFKRTHQFHLQTWEAVAHVMVVQYLSENDMDDLPIFVANKLKELTEQKLKTDVAMKTIQLLIADKVNYSAFHQYLQQKSQADSTLKLWSDFLINDCFAYIGLIQQLEEETGVCELLVSSSWLHCFMRLTVTATNESFLITSITF